MFLVAMSWLQVIQDELGAPWYQVFAELTPEPIAAASLGQVYRGRLKTGEDVAVKVQRPGVLETVTIGESIAAAACCSTIRLSLFVQNVSQPGLVGQASLPVALLSCKCCW